MPTNEDRDPDWLRLKAIIAEVAARIGGAPMFEDGAEIHLHPALAAELAKPENAVPARVLEVMRQDRLDHRKRIEEGFADLAARGLIYDSGERRKGQIVWRVTPGKEAELKALQEEDWDEEDSAEE